MDIYIYLSGRQFLSPAIFNSILVVGVLCIFFIICGAKVKKADPGKPSKGLVFFMEFAVTSIDGFAKSMIGDVKGKYSAFIGFLIFYLFPANAIGILGFTAPTSNYSVTLTMAIFTLTYIAFAGISAKGIGGYLKDIYLGDVPALVLLNIISEASKILSLSFRLFGNIMSGAMVSAVVLTLLSWGAIAILPVLNIYFDLFAGAMQTAIFCILTMVWMSSAVIKSEET